MLWEWEWEWECGLDGRCESFGLMRRQGKKRPRWLMIAYGGSDAGLAPNVVLLGNRSSQGSGALGRDCGRPANRRGVAKVTKFRSNLHFRIWNSEFVPCESRGLLAMINPILHQQKCLRHSSGLRSNTPRSADRQCPAK